MTPPARASSPSIASYTVARMMTEFSDEHDVALSKVLERAIFAAASARSALASTIDTTLPWPTPIAGLPLEYAARMFACEPVAAIRSAWRISS